MEERQKDVDFAGLRTFENMYRHRAAGLFLVNLGEQYRRENIRIRLPFPAEIDIT